MKWDCGPTWLEKYEASKQWHAVFAWLPRRVGSHDCRWLEWIERRWVPSKHFAGIYGRWEYRPWTGIAT